jgi:hypothetical protein
MENNHEENNVACQCCNDWRLSRRTRKRTGRSTDGRHRQGRCAEGGSRHRASKVIGSNVLNEANETIGKIDDLLVTRDGKEPYAVLSIGGFLGMGTHMVVVRYDSLKFADNKIVLPGGSKDGLKMLPVFQYSKE